MRYEKFVKIICVRKEKIGNHCEIWVEIGNGKRNQVSSALRISQNMYMNL